MKAEVRDRMLRTGCVASTRACCADVSSSTSPTNTASVCAAKHHADEPSALVKTSFRLAIAAIALLTLAVTARAADVTHISGGIGSTERDELRTKEREYNLKIITAMKSGDYRSGVQIVIESSTKERMLETTMAGPILLAKLPPGSYTITATASGQTLTQTVAIEAQGLKQVDFRWGDGR
jgi:hypothetical protein